MFEIDLLKALWALTVSRIHDIKSRDNGEGGWSVVEVAIWVGVFATAAIVIGGILVAKARDKASSIQTQ